MSKRRRLSKPRAVKRTVKRKKPVLRTRPQKRIERKPAKRGKPSPRSKPTHRKTPPRPSEQFLTKRRLRQFQAQMAAERLAAKERVQKRRLDEARAKFKPRKKDRGKLVFISSKGKVQKRERGKTGHLVYVTKTGKVWYQKQKGKTRKFAARTLADLQPSGARNLRKAAREFQLGKRALTQAGRGVLKGQGNVTAGGQWDFSDKVVTRIARGLKKVIERQASKRSFLISANVLIRKADGSLDTLSFVVPIDKADHISIRLAGLENFVRQKFYAFMARELAFHGFVSSGSANHIRRLADNKGVERDKWTGKDGERWEHNENEQVTIVQIEWKMEQNK